MRRLTCHIEVGKFEFDFVTDVEIETSWKKLTDLATIVLPRKIKWKDRLLKDEIKKGDAVKIELGYDFENEVEFEGFVSAISTKIPVEIKCEDSMWKLKQTSVSQSWRSVTLKALLSAVVPAGIEFEGIDMNLGPFRIDNASVAKVLDTLKKRYGVYSYFRSKKLIVGFAYDLNDNPRTGVFEFEKDIISDRLKFLKDDDLKIKVRAISMLPNGSKIEKILGDVDGELHSLHFYNLDAAQLEINANEEMKKLKFTGYEGRLEVFGSPFLEHGDLVELKGGEYPERAGTYFIDEIRTRFGQRGFRRQLNLGRKAE